MRTRFERRGQLEIGIIEHEGRTFAAFEASVCGRNITAYTGTGFGHLILTTWCRRTMLACRSEVVREYHDGSVALLFRLTQGRFVVGYAHGEHGCLFRGELLTDGDGERARQKALVLADHWPEIDAEDDANPWGGESGDGESCGW